MDWTQVALAFIAGVPSTLGAIAAFIVSLRNNKKIDANTKELEKNTQITEQTAQLTEKAGGELAAKAEENATATASLNEKADALATAVNGHLEEKVSLARREAYAAAMLESAQLKETIALNSDRLTKLESGHAKLEAGQLEITSRLDRMIDLLAKK